MSRGRDPTIEFPAALIHADGTEERFTLTYNTVDNTVRSGPFVPQAGDTIVIRTLPRWLRQNR